MQLRWPRRFTRTSQNSGSAAAREGNRASVSALELNLASPLGLEILPATETALATCTHCNSADDRLWGNTLPDQIERAITAREFYLEFQPEVDITFGDIVAVEVLLRWKHPELGLISPDTFIPAAEETGTISAIGSWVLSNACAQLAAWRRYGFARDIRIAVNVSPVQLQSATAALSFLATIERHGLRANDLIAEITEGFAGADSPIPILALQALHDAGVTIAIDDFGTGYSSLSYLARLPIDMIKIDRSFVTMSTESGQGRFVLKSLLAMCDSLGYETVVEGVETVQQADVIRDLGCKLVQGYLYSPPMSATKFVNLLESAPGAPWSPDSGPTNNHQPRKLDNAGPFSFPPGTTSPPGMLGMPN